MNPLEDDLRRGLRALTDDPPPMTGLHEPVVRRARAARIRTTVASCAAGVAVVAAAALVWPASEASPPPVAGTGDARPGVVAGTPYPHRLYVHCGIRYARFDDRWWQAAPPREAPSAPAGEDGNYLTGTMTLTDAGHASFRGGEPALTVEFTPYPGEPAPCD
ncbi:hypothetical protein [Actinoplanes sp. URMC 104]|uniref:hypothetical protein n=1 Tax=Actinoplanes sp. URMC 104 TaxID=3423409 RepID=UPI003F1BF3E2